MNAISLANIGDKHGRLIAETFGRLRMRLRLPPSHHNYKVGRTALIVVSIPLPPETVCGELLILGKSVIRHTQDHGGPYSATITLAGCLRRAGHRLDSP